MDQLHVFKPNERMAHRVKKGVLYPDKCGVSLCLQGGWVEV